MKRVRNDGFVRGEHLEQTGPFVLDTRFHDIPTTVEEFIKALPPNCVGLSLRAQGGRTMLRRAQEVARKRGIRVFIVR